MIKKTNDFVKNSPNDSNLCLENTFLSIIFAVVKLIVLNFYLKNYWGCMKIVLRSKMYHDQFYKTVFLFLWMDEKKISSCFSCANNSFPSFRAFGELFLVALHIYFTSIQVIGFKIFSIRNHISLQLSHSS